MTWTKDGNPLFGESNIGLREKITPPLSDKEEAKLNAENEWYQFLKGDVPARKPALRRAKNARIKNRY
jgi:hypothetical protein